MSQLLSFHGKSQNKEFYLARIRAHAEADEIIKGKYWENGKGCAVGCTIHGSSHKKYETDLGLPEWLAKLQDRLFENLPNGKAKAFPLAFLQAIPIGVNMEPVKWQFCSFLLKENIDRVLSLNLEAELKSEIVKAIRQVLAVCENALSSGKWDESAAWSAAASAAESAAYTKYAEHLLTLLKNSKNIQR